MRHALQQLMSEADSAEQTLVSNAERSAKATQTVEALKVGLSRLRKEVFDRVWAGETTGDTITDIIIATKGAYHKDAIDKLRALVQKFAAHEGQFVAGRYRSDTYSFHHILVGIIAPGGLTFCPKPGEKYTKPYISLPINPAISYQSDWQWGFNNLQKSEWRITIDTEEACQRQRCWDLEKFFDEQYSYIQIGDEAVCESILKTGQHRFGPIATFIHIASALGRPLMTVPTLKQRVEPFVKEIKKLGPACTKLNKAFAPLPKPLVALGENLFVHDIVEEMHSAQNELKTSLEAMEVCLEYAYHPHDIKTKKSA